MNWLSQESHGLTLVHALVTGHLLKREMQADWVSGDKGPWLPWRPMETGSLTSTHGCQYHSECLGLIGRVLFGKLPHLAISIIGRGDAVSLRSQRHGLWVRCSRKASSAFINTLDLFILSALCVNPKNLSLNRDFFFPGNIREHNGIKIPTSHSDTINIIMSKSSICCKI